MSDYRVADGHDVILGSLTVIDPQPRSEGVKATRRSYGAGGAVYDEGRYVELEWSAVATKTQYTTILAYFGLNGLPLTYTNDVTVYVRDELFGYIRMNGTAVLPEVGRDVRWRNYFPRDVVILVKNLVNSS